MAEYNAIKINSDFNQTDSALSQTIQNNSCILFIILIILIFCYTLVKIFQTTSNKSIKRNSQKKKKKGEVMIILAFILIMIFSLFSLSLIAASKEFQKIKPDFEKLLNSKNEVIVMLTEKMIKDSLSFFSIYSFVFKKSKNTDINKHIDLTKEEEEAIKILVIGYLKINTTAYWYNYVIIFILISIVSMFKKINLSIFDMKETIFNAERTNLFYGQKMLANSQTPH